MFYIHLRHDYNKGQSADELDRKLRAMFLKKYGEPSIREMESWHWNFDGGKRSLHYTCHSMGVDFPNIDITATANDLYLKYKQAHVDNQLKKSDANML